MAATRYAALLRGVNVGGQKVPMAELRTLLADLGFDDVSTLLQSGNALFTAPEADLAELAATVEKGLADTLGLAVPVLIRTHPHLVAVVEGNPFPTADEDPAKHLVQFLFAPLADADRAELETFDASAFAPEELRIDREVLYFRFPQGIGRNVMDAAFSKHLTANFAKPVRPVMTGRNWNTVRKLRDLTAP